MKLIPRLSLLCLLVTLPLLAQSQAGPVVIETIQPSVGSTEGGELVTITGTGLTLPDNFACLVPCPTTVRFGTATVEAIHEEDTRVTVRTPAHAAGVVDVTVRTGDGRSATKENAFTFVAETEPGYASFLLPVYLDGTVHGERGSMWTTEFWIRNNGTRNANLAPWICPDGQACLPVVPLTRALLPNENLRNLPAMPQAPSANPGRMLYVSRSEADFVSASLRVWDISRDAHDAGAQLPIIRDEDMLTSTANLMSVPLQQNFRLHLRIYDTAWKESSFRVRVYAQNEGVDHSPALLKDLTLPATTTDNGPFRIRPAYAEYTAFADLLDLDIPLSRLRIEVEPLTPGSIFWTFVAITNNDTQRLTIVTP